MTNGARVVISVLCLVLCGGVANAGRDRFCSQTAKLLFGACGHEVQQDFARTNAVCINVSDKTARAACLAEATAARREGRELCAGQKDLRLGACKTLGEGRYDPGLDPATFDSDFTNLTTPNPYYPLTIGNRWEFRGGNELNVIDILAETKLIDGVTCIVAQDQVFRDGDLHENTDDWFCQKKNGDVWYLGEEVKNFESFAGDNPRLPELVDVDGSFKSGRDGDKGGTIFLLCPKPGDIYIEEFSLANAEDVTEILSVTYAFGNDPALDERVPQELAQRMCAGADCVVTRNYSLLEPGIFARKYYARGIGVFLEVEVEPDSSEVLVPVQLVNCNFDARCVGLPAPLTAATSSP